MKFTIDREALLKPLQAVAGVVERRQTLPILSNVLLTVKGRKLSMTATDLEVEMITHSALVNHGGGLRKEREFVYANPVHWVSHLYGNLPEASLVRTETFGETFRTGVEGISKMADAPLLDAVGALSADGARLILLAINRDPSRAVEATVVVHGFAPGPEAEAQTVAGEGYMAKNTRENPDAVRLERSRLPVAGPEFRVTFAPHSVTAVIVPRG